MQDTWHWLPDGLGFIEDFLNREGCHHFTQAENTVGHQRATQCPPIGVEAIDIKSCTLVLSNCFSLLGQVTHNQLSYPFPQKSTQTELYLKQVY